jgi:hypothetical protein
VLLIFDDVITGFRMAPGGAQAHFGVTPDLTTLAKALAAGEKLSVVCGREDVVQVVDPTADASVPGVERIQGYLSFLYSTHQSLVILIFSGFTSRKLKTYGLASQTQE